MSRTIEALVTFLPTASGRLVRLPGLRPQLEVGESRTSCIVTPLDGSVHEFAVGHAYAVRIEPMFGDRLRPELDLLKQITLWDGSWKVAVGHRLARG